ncbi:restriction endonuclease subunit S [Micrococcus luteus]|nr:restriction endonuclease subunit S [Micrococcus luteus]MCV7586537.1 restriction endonuclease subunit S [Micrococcus luteus]MCV7643342.1 restriction endonuclease subunit S [Micrococcus luteus]
MQLRRVAQVNPPVPELRGLGEDEVTFLPLEAVWPDGRRRYEFTKPANTAGYTVLRRGDVVMPKITPTFEAGRVFVAGDLPTAVGLATTEVHVLRPRGIEPRYLAYFLRTQPVLSEGETVLQGVGNLRRVTAEWVSTLSIPVDNESDQARIADYLDRETATIDALIEKQVELMNRLRERRQAVIDRAFVSTSEIVILRRHLVLNDSGAWGEDPTGADDVAVLRSTEQTVDGHWVIGDPALRSLSQTERRNTRLREGDLIVTKTSGSFKHVGKTTLVDNEVAEGGYGFGNFMQRLRLRPTMIPKFLWWFMRTDQARSWINLVATTSTGLMNLNGSALGRMEVPLPGLVEQREIADHLDRETAKIDALIAKAERFIELAQERRAALITAAVTGQIEIPSE